jgi:polyphosphate kinase
MNALTEPDVVRALYQASQAGVEIDLIVRGACRLRPGIPGVSDNIRVRSIVGRFLEHERVACFYADGEDRVYCSSADWMSRNLLRRVELCYPILDLALKRRVIEESLTMGLADDTRAWELQADGSWVPTVCRSDAPTTAQLQLLERLSEPPRR